MQKFNFSIQTRDGQRIVSVVIAGRDQQEAEHKLRQMYRHCEVMSCNANQMDDHKTQQVVSVEDIITLISK
ncbi:MAG: hypothetical protein Q7T25_09210 [Sideroxyarcus sp.]|nr:hypothetical protein [Sideroxyarcus sp.]